MCFLGLYEFFEKQIPKFVFKAKKFQKCVPGLFNQEQNWNIFSGWMGGAGGKSLGDGEEKNLWTNG
jgi:hypothetical protein